GSCAPVLFPCSFRLLSPRPPRSPLFPYTTLFRSSVFGMLSPEDIMLVTDAMAAAGMPDGEYDLGPVRVRVADGVARLVDGDAIAGGTAHLLDVVRSTVAAGVPLVDAVRSASFTPARALGLEEQVGALHAGLRADVLVADGDLVPQAVARAGRWVHSTE